MGIPKEHVQAMSLWEVNQNRSPTKSIFKALRERREERRLPLARTSRVVGTGHIETHACPRWPFHHPVL